MWPLEHAHGAQGQLRNIRLIASCVDLLVVRRVMSWHLVCVAQCTRETGNTVIKSRTVVKCTWEQTFESLLQHLGVVDENVENFKKREFY